MAKWLRGWISNPGVPCSKPLALGGSKVNSGQPFILPRSIKWVPGISGNLMVKSKLPPWSGSSLQAVEPHPWKGAIKFFCFLFYIYMPSYPLQNMDLVWIQDNSQCQGRILMENCQSLLKIHFQIMDMDSCSQLIVFSLYLFWLGGSKVL